MVFADRKLKLREIADTLKISEGSLFAILYKHLSMRKLCSKWVPRLLTVDQKQKRVDDSEPCLELFQRNKKDYFMRCVTMDETWTERGLGTLVAARSARHLLWLMDGRLFVSGVEGPSCEIAASQRLKQKTRPTHGSFSATNKAQVVEVLSPERVARNLTWTVGLSLSRARAPKLPKQATDRPCVKMSGAPTARQPEAHSPFRQDSSLHSRVKSAVSWMDSKGWKSSKATKNSTVGWQGYGIRILERAWYFVYRLSW